LKLSRDGWGGLAVLAASLLLFWGTLGLKDNPLVPIGPGFYPRIVVGITALFALILIVSDWLSPAKFPSAGPLNYRLVAAMFALFGVYVSAMPYLGFRISTLLYIAATNWLLEPPRSPKGWLRVGLVALIATAVIYVMFERYLLVLLPRGRWTDF
jgi:putative tricarboxylic transport membrane protein